MDALELDQRCAVVGAARSWIRTPFHHHSAVKGAGIDCAHLLYEAHAEAGLIDRFEVEPYPADWALHRDEERFLAKLDEYGTRIDDCDLSIRERGPDFSVYPGNILIWKYGRTFSHGAIVAEWPNIVHASFPAQVCLEESVRGHFLESQPMRVYSFWGR